MAKTSKELLSQPADAKREANPNIQHAASGNGIRVILYLALALPFWLGGCASQEADHTHTTASALRDRGITYYSNQVMNNLIRGSKGMLLVSLDITNLQADVKSQIAGTLSAGDTLTDMSSAQSTASTVTTNTEAGSTLGHMVAATAGLVTIAGRTVAAPYMASVNPQLSDDLIFATKPNTGDSAVYLPYVQFLQLPSELPPHTDKYRLYIRPMTNLDIPDSDDISSLRQVDEGNRRRLAGFSKDRLSTQEILPDKTTSCVRGTLTKWDDGQYYYVPGKYKQAYFELCLALTSRVNYDPHHYSQLPGMLKPPTASATPGPGTPKPSTKGETKQRVGSSFFIAPPAKSQSEMLQEDQLQILQQLESQRGR